MTPRRALTPLPILLHASLKHLIGMKSGVLAQYRARKRGDQRLYRMGKDKVMGNKAPSRFNGSLTVEHCEKGLAQFAVVAGHVIELIVTLAWKPCWWHVEEADQIDFHCPMEHTA
jgi:hypothetical protein